MASPARFERTTCFLGGSRSIQLSYGDLRRIMMPVGPDNNPNMRPAVLNALSAAVLVLAAMSVAAAAPPTRGFRPDDVNRLQNVSDPVFAPDGKHLAYSVETADAGRDVFSSDLWTVALDGTPPRRLTATPHSEWQPVYAPDGHALYFLSDAGEDGITQVWRMTLHGGGPALAVTRVPQGVDDYALSPDGRHLALIVRDAEYPDGKRPPNPKPFVSTRFQFMEDVTGYLDERRLHLYLLDLAGGEPVALTRGPYDHYLPAFSPDGTRIAYVSKRGKDPDRHSNWDLFMVEAVAGGAETQLTRYPGSDLDPYWETRPAWSPDGRRIAYVRSEAGQWIYYAPWQLAVLELDTGREYPPALADRFSIKPQWLPDSRHLAVLVEAPQAMHAVKVDVGSGKTTMLTRGGRYDYGLAVSRQGEVVVNGSTPLRPFELSRVRAGGRLTALTAHNAWLSALTLAPVEDIRFRSADGTEIDGLLLKPLDAVPGRRYPTILRLHGGPVYQFSREFMADWQAYAAAGFAVLAVNPRGSSGRGFEFAKAIYADWGNRDVQDVLAGVDHAVALGVADPQRLGVGGWSYGGILTNYVIAADARFQAAVSGAGATNTFASYGFDQYTREYEAELGTPWDNPDAYARVSRPFLQAGRIATPTLFQCAERDFNVPCLGAMQMYQALRSRGVPTQLVVYPGQYHGLSVPSYLVDRLQRHIDWYSRYLMPRN